jgi:hypothetical protein
MGATTLSGAQDAGNPSIWEANAWTAPHRRTHDRVDLCGGHARTDQARWCASGVLQDRVDLYLDGGGVLVDVDAEDQQPSRDRRGGLRGAGAGLGEQERPRPQVGPSPCRQALHRRDRARRPQLGRQAVQQHRAPPRAGVGQQRLDGLVRRGDEIVVDTVPSGDGQLLEPGPGPVEQVVRPGLRLRRGLGPGGAGSG